jgi:FkbM family methyltransferase
MPVIAGTARLYTLYAPWHLGKSAVVNRLFWWPYEFTVQLPGGANIRGITSDYIHRRIFYYGVWEPSVTERLSVLRPGDVFVDIGANIGYFTLLAAARVGPGGRVIAVESTPSIFSALVRNVELNSFRNIRCVNAAASAAPGRVTAYRCLDANLGGSNITGDGIVQAEGEVDALPVDQILSDDERCRVRLMKIDVEGVEEDVCRGMARTIRDGLSELELLVEINPPDGVAALETGIASLLRNEGFRAYKLPRYWGPPPYRLSAPRRLPSDATGQIEVVFSRATAECLPS